MTSLFTRDPLYRPDPEMSPRLRAIFWDKRRLVLPSSIQLHYERGKAAFDRREYKVAADAFSEVLAALSDPDIAQQASRPPLSDVRVLAAGFNDLAVRALTPEPSSRPEPTYRPATLSGVAVKYRKRIQVNLSRTSG